MEESRKKLLIKNIHPLISSRSLTMIDLIMTKNYLSCVTSIKLKKMKTKEEVSEQKHPT
jgi:hypothetical protein